MITIWGLAVCLLACSVISKPVREEKAVIFKLQNKLIPTVYTIDLKLDAYPNGKESRVTIEATIPEDWTDEDAKAIYLHRGESIIDAKATVERTREGSDENEPVIISEENEEGEFKEDEEIWTIPLKEDVDLAEGDIITIGITFNFNPKEANGIYEYSYKTEDSEDGERFLLTTHFQPTYARTLFPCFDEPSLQAKFTLTLHVPEGYSAISNTDVDPVTHKESNEMKFKETPTMSTYMLAFIMYHEEDFGRAEDGSTKIAVTFNTWGRKSEVAGTTDFGEQYEKLVEKMESYTGIEYNGDSKTTSGSGRLDNIPTKIDQVAIPGYPYEPMDTFGLLTSDESTVLLKESGHKQEVKYRTIKTLAYGVAHHWFGDLVTSESWDSAWLNEGFSTFFSYLLSEEAEEDNWRMEERLVVEEQMKALEADAYLDTPALTAEATSSDEILARFGIIASSKGASVLRMFKNVVGEDNFKNAVQNFLNGANGMANEDNLFNELASGDIKADSFKIWTAEKGYPVVTVAKAEDTVEGEDGEQETRKGIEFTQERYLVEGEDKTTLYHLHLDLQTNAEEKTKIQSPVHVTDKKKFVVGEIDDASWVLVKSNGYFRVNYESNNWNLLAAHLRNQLKDDSEEADERESGESEIEPVERAVLVDNALNFAKAGKLKYKDALAFALFLEEEEDYIPWAAALPSLDFLHRMVAKPSAARDDSPTIDTFIMKITNKVMHRLLNGNINDHLTKLHRSNIWHLSCRAGNEDCLNKAEEKFDSYLENPEDVDLRRAVFCYGVQDNAVNWKTLLEKINGVETAEGNEREDVISALGCSADQETLQNYFDMIVLDSFIRESDVPAAFSSVYTNVVGTDMALNVLIEDIQSVIDKTSIETVQAIINDMAKYLYTEEQKKLLNDITIPGLDVTEAVNILQQNEIWINTYADAVKEAIEEVLSGDSTTTDSTTTDSTTTDSTTTDSTTTDSTTTDSTTTDSTTTDSTTTASTTTASTTTASTTTASTTTASTTTDSTTTDSTTANSTTTDSNTSDSSTTGSPGAAEWLSKPATTVLLVSFILASIVV